MAEYALTTDSDGMQYQFVDEPLFMVIDMETAEPQRFGKAMHATGSREEAIAFLTERPAEKLRFAAVSMRVIRGHAFHVRAR